MSTQPLSLFAGDSLWGTLARLGLGRPDRPALSRAVPCLIALLWGSLAITVLVQNALGFDSGGRSFFLDWSALAQFWIGVPVLLAAEVHVDWRIKAVHTYIGHSGVLPTESQHEFLDLSRRISAIQRSRVDWLAWPLGMAITAFWLSDELRRGAVTWYTYASGGQTHLSPAGWCAAVLSIGFLNALWFRWAWKTTLWCRFLWRFSRLRLTLHPDHPDLMGGLGIVSWVQMGFALAGFGIASVMAATVWYNIAVKGMDAHALGVWLPLVAFFICAPVFFITPLLFFTTHLLRAKQRGLTEMGAIGMRYATLFETHAEATSPDREGFSELGRQLGGLAALSTSYQHVEHMRIVPFDLKSLGQFLLSSGSPFLPVLVKYMPFLSWFTTHA